ncbi:MULTISPECIES: cell division protein ZapE [unclassified Cryobacterium]|uniref:cell division protein ZapE n=1 Tax=unclassified Cryobacterium TaxID=2649013 RepID=UPI00106A1FF4|nr:MULTISPECIES: cell division protein ZapE [unclassified Cryobacterium]MDY7527948.1 cell division protein ZapE [Cryobacterium sp. 10C2]MDY7556291.1 cell division protein ZapE [Cryobacterium sp. 10C3]MEB0201873.1 cell division protein ZapE [Cryobacterium sp. 5I3]MEB0288041.1 cell division protein ZapE [Cryobacterium sp. 10S3]MEB0289968.1 cell division protein ZapE [Cryobacterium sp. 10C2]
MVPEAPRAPSRLHRLAERSPEITGAEIVAELVPPPQFEHASFESYRPDVNFPSQLEAVDRLTAFAEAWRPQRPGGFFSRTRKAPAQLPGIYLDGGFGVGKTHLLAALWHSAPGPKYFGTFIEYTALVGALGYAAAVRQLSGAKLICIDEFELDDPGDTMLMTRLLGELVASGTRVAATSNTPPNSLGEGRFAAIDFLREIRAMSANFEILRIDGLDYRRRDIEGHSVAVEGPELDRLVAALVARGANVTEDDFGSLIRHLSTVHPSKYIKLIAGVEVIALTDSYLLTDQTDALRLVAFIDRVYDAEIPIVASGLPLAEVFDDEMLAGGYRKKYQRSQSRMVALTTGELPPHD